MDLLYIIALRSKAEDRVLSIASESLRSTIYWLRRGLDVLLSSELAIPTRCRVENTARMLESVRAIGLPNPSVTNSLNTIPTVLLLYRLKEGPNHDWKLVDKVLLDLFKDGWGLQSVNACSTSLKLIGRQNWEEDDTTLIVCCTRRTSFASHE